MADGKIKIETKLDNKGVEKDLKGLVGMVQRTSNNIKKAFNSAGGNNESLKQQLAEQKKLLKEQESTLNNYQKRIDSIENETPVKAIQKQINAENKIVENGKKKLDEYKAKMAELEAAAQKIESEALSSARLGGTPGTSFDDSPKNLRRRANESLNSDKDYQKIIDQEIALGQKMDQYSGKVKDAESKVKELGASFSKVKANQTEALSGAMNEYGASIEKTKGKITSLQSALDKLKNKANISKSVDKNSDSMKKASQSATSFGNNVSKSAEKGVSKLAKMGLAIFAVRSAYTFARRAASEYLASNEQLANQVTAIWNVVAQAIGPVVQTIIGWITTLIGYINAFIKSLTGVDLIARGNAAALNKQASATAKTAKETEKANRQLAAFDEMNKLNRDSSSSGGGGSGGASIPQLSVDPINIDGLKEKLLKLFEPIKNAWANYGQAFVDSFKYGLGQIWELIKSIGRSFEEVWLNGTGELTCSLILQILTNIFTLVGNLARQFRIAWDAAGVGTQIIQNIWDVVNILLGGVNDVAKSLADWAGTIDFSPLLKSVEKLTARLKPLAEVIVDNVKWAFDNVLEPLGSWVIEDAVPAAIDAFSGGLKILSGVLEALKEPSKAIWNKFLKPIASWTGGIIVTVLEGLATVLETIGDWITKHKTAFTVLAVILGSLAGAFGIVKGASFLVVKGFEAVEIATKAFGAVMGFITSPIFLVVAAVAAVVAIIALLIIYWDDVSAAASACWDWICEKWSEAGEFFSGILDNIHDVFDSIGAWFEMKFQEAYDSVCNVFTGIGSWFSDRYKDITNAMSNVGTWFGDMFNRAYTSVANAFANVGQFFSGVWSNIKGVFGDVAGWFRGKFTDAWTAVKNVFSTGGKIFDGIKDGILNGLKAVVNAIITGINKVIKIPFDGINSALKSIKKVNILGFTPFDWLGTINVPQIPKLAKGGIVNNPGAGVNMGNYIAGERGPEAVIPLSDAQFVKDFAEEIAKHIDTSSPINIVLKIGEKEFYKWFINMQKKYNYITNGG